MYSQDFYITEPTGNNAFSFENRTNKKLFVPKLKSISDITQIEMGTQSVFEDVDEYGTLQVCYGLKNLYRMDWYGTPLYLVDNHNHVFYFWYLARSQGIITNNSLVYHIDEHADTRDPGVYLDVPDAQDLQKVFSYTNFTLNVGNYIIPAQREGLVGEVIQIRSEQALTTYLTTESGSKNTQQTRILNLDLDFFSPGLDYIDYELKKRVIMDIAQKANLITVCTSPFFIDQDRAIEVFCDIFG